MERKILNLLIFQIRKLDNYAHASTSIRSIVNPLNFFFFFFGNIKIIYTSTLQEVIYIIVYH